MKATFKVTFLLQKGKIKANGNVIESFLAW